jgi:hypothetical protein
MVPYRDSNPTPDQVKNHTSVVMGSYRSSARPNGSAAAQISSEKFPSNLAPSCSRLPRRATHFYSALPAHSQSRQSALWTTNRLSAQFPPPLRFLVLSETIHRRQSTTKLRGSWSCQHAHARRAERASELCAWSARWAPSCQRNKISGRLTRQPRLSAQGLC